MQVRNNACNAPVNFLREWLPFVMCAQARLHMTDLNSSIVCKQGGNGYGGGVALDKNPFRVKIVEHNIQIRKNRGAEFGQRLIITHEVEIVVRLDLKQC